MSTFVTVKEKTLARCRKMGSTIISTIVDEPGKISRLFFCLFFVSSEKI